jgi:hypothetical protein
LIIQSQRSSSRIGAILSLLGGALVIYGVFFLPMVFGNGGGSFTPTSEWEVANNGHPLYTYSGDTAAGQTTGEGVGGVWHVVTPSLA